MAPVAAARRRTRAAAWLLAGAALGSACASGPAPAPRLRLPEGAPAGLGELLQRLPARDARQQEAVASALLQMGAPAIAGTCELLGAPGPEETAARYALWALVQRAARPGAPAPERETLAAALGRALDGAAEARAAIFLAELLQALGEEAGIEPLRARLADPAVADTAARALAAIGSPAAGAALLQALEASPEPQRPHLLQALGDVAALRGDDGAAAVLAGHLDSPSAHSWRAAWYALVRIAPASTAPALRRRFSERADDGDLSLAPGLLDYARRIAVADRELAVSLAHAVADTAARAAGGGTASAARVDALRTLAALLGEQARPLLLAARSDPDPALRAAALQEEQALERARQP